MQEPEMRPALLLETTAVAELRRLIGAQRVHLSPKLITYSIFNFYVWQKSVLLPFPLVSKVAKGALLPLRTKFLESVGV